MRHTTATVQTAAPVTHRRKESLVEQITRHGLKAIHINPNYAVVILKGEEFMLHSVNRRGWWRLNELILAEALK